MSRRLYGIYNPYATLTIHHLLIGAIRDGKQMRRDFIPSLANVHFHHRIGVDGISLVWIDDNAKQARIGLKENDNKQSEYC